LDFAPSVPSAVAALTSFVILVLVLVLVEVIIVLLDKVANSCNCIQPSSSFVCLNLGLFAKVEEADRVYWDTVDKG